MYPGTSTVVMEPVTQHAAKGDGPKVFTDKVVLDLNGMSMKADEGYDDNLGIVLAGDRNTLTNSSTVSIALTSGFGHNIDIEATNPTVSGLMIGDRQNIETTGGLGVRLSSGDVLVENVRSIDFSYEAGVPVGVGFEIRRCGRGTATIKNNYFVGNGEGVLVRECGTTSRPGLVVLKSNDIFGPGEVGVNTREAVGTVIDDNDINLAYPDPNDPTKTKELIGSTGIRWALGSTGLQITNNRITNYHRYPNNTGEPVNLCGIEISSGTNLPTRAKLETDNPDIEPPPAGSTARKVCLPPNTPPVAAFTATVGAFQATAGSFPVAFADQSRDADGRILSRVWNFGDGTGNQLQTALNFSRPYQLAGVYPVTLTVTDNGAENTTAAVQRSVTIPVPLTATASPTARSATLSWFRTPGPKVDVLGVRGTGTPTSAARLGQPDNNPSAGPNSPVTFIHRPTVGGDWTYRVCSTTQPIVCSPNRTVRVR
jgi:PKD repeat protein